MRALKIILLLLFTYSGSAYAKENLHIFVFKNGVAQSEIEIQVGNKKARTNNYGYVSFELSGDEYEVGYYKKGELFALTDVKVMEGQESQIFLDLTSDKASVELDLPLSAYDQNFDAHEVKKNVGPKGTLILKLTDAKSKNPVVAARAYVRGYDVEAVSNSSGELKLELATGEYDISIIHPKYIMGVLRDIKAVANSERSEPVSLIRADIVLAEYVVSAPFVEGSMASTFTALKNNDVLADSLSSEQFSKSGDSSASSALKRVTGITVVGGKYVYIRGLGESESAA